MLGHRKLGGMQVMRLARTATERVTSALTLSRFPQIRIAIPALSGDSYKRNVRRTTPRGHGDLLNQFREDLDAYIGNDVAAGRRPQ